MCTVYRMTIWYGIYASKSYFSRFSAPKELARSREEVRLAELLQLERRVAAFEDWDAIRKASAAEKGSLKARSG